MKSIKFLLLLLSFSFIYSQDIFTAFTLEQCTLQKINYPWGDELSLQIKGTANPNLDEESLNIAVYFENQKFHVYTILLEKNRYNNIRFALSKEPINNPLQSIVPGKYQVKVNLVVNSKNLAQQEKLKRLTQGNKIRSYDYQFTIGTDEEIKIQSKENKLFYLRQMRELNNLLDDIFIQQKFVFQPTKKNNPYYQTPDKFNMQAWREWFQNITKKLVNQRESLGQYNKRSLTLLYPTTHQYLGIYNSIIYNIASQYANAVYNFKRIPDAKFVPPYKMDELYEELNGIYNMHQEMQKELKVNLKKVLGYFPPPPVLRP